MPPQALSIILMLVSVAGQSSFPGLRESTAETSTRELEARAVLTDYSGCPKDYPDYGALGDLLRAWNPNQPEVPEDFVETLQVLNYSDPTQRAQAEHLRDCEVPFKVYGVPMAEEASKIWTDEYLERNLQNSGAYNVLRSDTNRFMYWHKRRKEDGGGLDWTPPTQPANMPFDKWREWSREADRSKIGPKAPHYYLTHGAPASAKTPGKTGLFVADDLPFFSTRVENFFITDVVHQKGIQCRFGARGIIAESHFDHGKNFVLMLRGRKRYLLNPPKACNALGIISEMHHPSFRHSRVDWSDEQDWPNGFADAPAVETVIERGQLLYIPSFWYHYIVSEGFSVQCNARSGVSMREEWIKETELCMGRPIPIEALNNMKGRGGRLRGHAGKRKGTRGISNR